MRVASYGAQVILDYDGDAALAARGGAAGTITDEYHIIRDADLVELGHDPKSMPSNDRLRHPAHFLPGKGTRSRSCAWIDEQGRRGRSR